MFQVKLRLSIFLIFVLIKTILSVPVDINNYSEDCEKSHKCNLSVKPSSYVETNKKLTQSSSLSSQHEDTRVVTEGDVKLIHSKSNDGNYNSKEVLATLSKQETIHVSPESGDVLSQSNHVELNSQSSQKSLEQSSKHKITIVKSGSDYMQPHENSGDANHESTQFDLRDHDANDQIIRLLLQVLANRSKHEETTKRGHVLINENPSDANNQMKKLLDDLSKNLSIKTENKGHASNEQLIQLIVQLLAQASKNEKTVVKSERDHVLINENSSDAKNQMKKLLDDLSKNLSIKTENKGHASNEQLIQLIVQLLAQSSKNEKTVVKSERDHVLINENSSDANNQMKKLLDDLSKNLSIKTENKGHASNEQLIQLIVQLLAQSTKNEKTVVKSERDHVLINENSSDANNQMKKLLDDLSKNLSIKTENKGHESNEQLIQLLLQLLVQSSKHEITAVKSERDHVLPSDNSGDANNQMKKLLDDLSKNLSIKTENKGHASNEQLTQLLLQLLAQSSKHEITVVKSGHDHVLINENSGDVNHKSTSVEHKSHVTNEQLVQVILQILAHKSKNEGDHVVPHENSENVNNELLKLVLELIAKKSTSVEHKTNDSNDQLIQLLLQLLAKSMKHEQDHVPPQKNSVDSSGVLLNLLMELCKNELTKVKQTSHDSNSQLTQLLLQLLAESKKRELTVVESKRNYVLLPASNQNPVELPQQELPNIEPQSKNVETSPKLIPTVTGLVKHQLDDVEGTLGKVTSILA